MARLFEIPGAPSFEIEHLVLDINGTLTNRGELLPGVNERIVRLRGAFAIHLLSADTFHTLGELSERLGVEARRIALGTEKRDLVRALGPEACAAVGNGRNDAEMLGEVRLGIAVLGPEGASGAALAAADLICPSIETALGLLEDPMALGATLRP